MYLNGYTDTRTLRMCGNDISCIENNDWQAINITETATS